MRQRGNVYESNTVANTAEIKENKKLAKEITKTSKSIHKKYGALKSGRVEKDTALEKYSRPLLNL